MSGDGRNPVVPVDVVQGIVSQLSEVSQHTTSATTAMRHLLAEIANLRELRTRDATPVVEALAAASTRSGSQWAVDNVVGRTTDPAVRKLQEKDPAFPKYDGTCLTRRHREWQGDRAAQYLPLHAPERGGGGVAHSKVTGYSTVSELCGCDQGS